MTRNAILTAAVFLLVDSTVRPGEAFGCSVLFDGCLLALGLLLLNCTARRALISDTDITIRTLLIKDRTVYIGAGAGIVADSDPEREQAECINKSRALIQAMRLAEMM